MLSRKGSVQTLVAGTEERDTKLTSEKCMHMRLSLSFAN